MVFHPFSLTDHAPHIALFGDPAETVTTVPETAHGNQNTYEF